MQAQSELKNSKKIRKKPRFIRQEIHKRNRLGLKWRKPKGLHSKLRLQKKGHGSLVRVGYGSLKEIRGLHRTGLKVINVYSLNQLKSINKEEGIIIGKIGLKKKIQIIKEALKLKITILNLKDPENFLKKVEEKLEKKKSESVKKKEKKEKGKKEREKLAEEKKKEEEEKEKGSKDKLAEKIEEEEKDKEKKKEKEKVLTKKV